MASSRPSWEGCLRTGRVGSAWCYAQGVACTPRESFQRTRDRLPCLLSSDSWRGRPYGRTDSTTQSPLSFQTFSLQTERITLSNKSRTLKYDLFFRQVTEKPTSGILFWKECQINKSLIGCSLPRFRRCACGFPRLSCWQREGARLRGASSSRLGC